MWFWKRTIEELEKGAKGLRKNKIFLLVGDLGAGKTTFVRLFLNKEVSSPSFSICNCYDVCTECWEEGCVHKKNTVYHFDFFKLQDKEVGLDFEMSVGLFDALDSTRLGDLVFIEWPKTLYIKNAKILFFSDLRVFVFDSPLSRGSPLPI